MSADLGGKPFDGTTHVSVPHSVCSARARFLFLSPRATVLKPFRFAIELSDFALLFITLPGLGAIILLTGSVSPF